jgi:hypothetical protein
MPLGVNLYQPYIADRQSIGTTIEPENHLPAETFTALRQGVQSTDCVAREENPAVDSRMLRYPRATFERR